jgi:hypothetical protein
MWHRSSKMAFTKNKTMKKNWDLLYGFMFLAIFVIAHTLLLGHYTKSRVTLHSGHFPAPDSNEVRRQRARRIDQNRQDFIEWTKKIKEPVPKNLEELQHLAVNEIYFDKIDRVSFSGPHKIFFFGEG